MYPWPPTLDASSIFSLSKCVATRQARRAFAVTLVSHLRQHGFARIRNHSMPPARVAELFKSHADFFSLPLSQKLAVRYNGGENPARGYSPLGFENTAKMRPNYHAASVYALASDTSSEASQLSALKAESLPNPLADSREIFTVGPPEDTVFPTPYPSKEVLPRFHSFMNSFFEELREICKQAIDLVELGLGAPTDCIRGPTGRADGTEIVMNFYPAVRRDTLQDEANAGEGGVAIGDAATRRIWPHTDGSIITALVQDGVGATGLEFEVRQSSGLTRGEGVSNPATASFAPLAIQQPGDIVLLVSDTLERWTNGYLRAAVHRVGLPPAMRADSTSVDDWLPARRTAIMLLRAPPSANLGALQHFVSSQTPSMYEAVTAEEFLKQINRRNYGNKSI